MKNIDFRNGRPLVMMVSQYDYGYDLQVALWTNGTPVTITAAEIVSENFTVACTFSGNVVTIPISTSMTEQFGHFPAELRVTDSIGQVSSKNFDFFVERSPLAVKSTQTYSGDIVEFTAKSVPLSSVVVTMEPIQSLNGYDAPWPAGGGKNLIPYPYSADAQTIISSGTWNGMTIAENNGKISVKGTQNYTSLCIFAFFKLKANTTYTFSTNYQYANDSTKMNCTIYDPTNAKLYATPKDATPVTFTTTEECTVRIYLNPSASNNGRSFDFTLQPQLEEGSSASEWTPYSNICPISGRTGASVVVVGKNLFADKGQGYWRVSDGAFITSGTTAQRYRSCEKIPVIAGAQYTGFVISTYDQPTSVYVQWWKADGTGSEVRVAQWPVVAPDDAVLMSYAFRFESPEIASTAINVIQVEAGSTPTEYEENKTTTYPITFTSAGTVYAGTVDLVSGKLVVTRGMLTLNTASMNNTDAYPGWTNCGIGDLIGANVNGAVNDALLNIGTALSANTRNYSPSNTGTAILPRATYGKTQTEWIALAMDVQMCVPLATPLTYNLTPTQVMSLLGENVVWSPDGEVTVVVPEYY